MNSGYTQLSYIYTNGNYVNTGITKNGSADTLKTTISFEFAATSSQTQGLFGSYYSSTREYNQYIGATTGKQWCYGWRSQAEGYDGDVKGGSWTTNTRYNIEALFYRYDKHLIVNGTTVISEGSFSSQGDYSTQVMYLFAWNQQTNNPVRICPNIKFYSCKIYHPQTTLVRDYVPAKRDSDNAVGVYDNVSNTFTALSGATYPCTLTLTKNISEAGSVSGGGSYNVGTSVTASASTNAGYRFVGWYSGSTLKSSNASYTFTLTADTSLEARWELDTYTITLSKNIDEAGTVSGAGIYTSGTSCTVSSTTNSGYRFLGWYNGDTLESSSASYTFTVSSTKSLQARWINTYTVSASSSDITYGTIISGTGTYDSGASVTLVAEALTGGHFSGWYDGNILKSFNLSYTFTLNSNVDYTAMFISQADVGKYSCILSRKVLSI